MSGGSQVVLDGFDDLLKKSRIRGGGYQARGLDLNQMIGATSNNLFTTTLTSPTATSTSYTLTSALEQK